VTPFASSAEEKLAPHTEDAGFLHDRTDLSRNRLCKREQAPKSDSAFQILPLPNQRGSRSCRFNLVASETNFGMHRLGQPNPVVAPTPAPIAARETSGCLVGSRSAKPRAWTVFHETQRWFAACTKRALTCVETPDITGPNARSIPTGRTNRWLPKSKSTVSRSEDRANKRKGTFRKKMSLSPFATCKRMPARSMNWLHWG